jgi:hypothetical protein
LHCVLARLLRIEEIENNNLSEPLLIHTKNGSDKTLSFQTGMKTRLKRATEKEVGLGYTKHTITGISVPL